MDLVVPFLRERRRMPFRLYPVDRLAVDRIRLAANGMLDARRRHQVALVRRVDEHPSAENLPRQRADRRDASVLHRHAALLAVQPFTPPDVESVPLLPAFQHGQCRRRLERPHRVLRVQGFTLSFGLVIALRLPFPMRRVVVVRADAAVELAGDAAEGPLDADVRLAEAARRQSADAGRRLQNHDILQSHALGLHGCRNPRRRATVDDEVECAFRFTGRPLCSQRTEHECTRHTSK